MKNNLFSLTLLAICLWASCKTVTPVEPVVPVTPVGPTPFAGVPSAKDAVMYEVNLRAMSSEGTFKGVEARLDAVKALGVNVLWLMPIHPVGVLKSVGQLGSPYSVQNYTAVNSEFGTLADFQSLVKAAHERNMAVVIDWVANHTSWDNPWIAAHDDWYTKDASGKITIPAGTNWADVADLNFNNAAMRQAMIEAMKYWILNANIDGFRCDYADGVPQDFWRQAIDSLKALPNRQYILLAEGSRADHYSAGFQMTYSWNFYGQLKNTYQSNLNAATIFTSHNNEMNSLPTDALKLRFTTNHDESAWDKSPVTLFNGQAGALSAFVLSAFVGGVPLMYSGQEVGRADNTPFFSRSAINWAANSTTLTAYQQLMTFRKSSIAARTGTLTSFADNDVVVFKKKAGTEEILVMVNLRNSVVNYNIATALANTNWINALDNTALRLGTQLTLQPYQYLILKL